MAQLISSSIKYDVCGINGIGFVSSSFYSFSGFTPVSFYLFPFSKCCSDKKSGIIAKKGESLL